MTSTSSSLIFSRAASGCCTTASRSSCSLRTTAGAGRRFAKEALELAQRVQPVGRNGLNPFTSTVEPVHLSPQPLNPFNVELFSTSSTLSLSMKRERMVWRFGVGCSAATSAIRNSTMLHVR